MYNFIVSGREEAWSGHHSVFPKDRFITDREHTMTSLATEYGELTQKNIQFLCQIPTIFACESGCKTDARIGRITGIVEQSNSIRIEYEIDQTYPQIPNSKLDEAAFEFGIGKYELSRTHWALKSEDINDGLKVLGLPEIKTISQPLVDIEKHHFDVAFSFPGEYRELVEQIANTVLKSLGYNSVFYDNFYKSQLAVPNLDLMLLLGPLILIHFW